MLGSRTNWVGSLKKVISRSFQSQWSVEVVTLFHYRVATVAIGFICFISGPTQKQVQVQEQIQKCNALFSSV